MLALLGRTIIFLFALQLGARLVHAGESIDAPKSQAVATASAQVIALCNVSMRPTPGCPTSSPTFTRLSGSVSLTEA